MKLLTLSLLSVSLFALFPGCNSDTADDTVAEPSRDNRIESFADAVCDRYEDTGAGCPGYGTSSNQKYQTETDCEADFKQRASTLWPADRCSDGRIDNSRFEQCIDRAKNFACSTGAQNFIDGIAALDDCSADKVCTDSAN